MAIFEDFCNSEGNKPKILKFEGNTPVIVQGSNYIFQSQELSLRYWYKEVTTWTTQTNTVNPSEFSEILFNFTHLFIIVYAPDITGISPEPVLDIDIELYLPGSVTPDLVVPIDDTEFMTLDEEFEKIIIRNNSTGLTDPHKYSILLVK